jgi:hypothetical protein
MFDGNEKAPRDAHSRGRTRRKRCRHNGAAPRVLQGFTFHGDPSNTPSDADPRSISHASLAITSEVR